MLPLPEKPFFVVGNPRSGTTLVRFILSSHPRIWIPAETGFLPFLQRNRRTLDFDQVQALLDRMGRLNYAWRGLIRDPQSFYTSLPDPTLRQVLDALYRRRMARRDGEAARWGDKTPTYVRYIADLNEIFPTAQFIHVIRDGRDATLSALAKWGRHRWYMDSYYLLKNWSRNVTSGRRAGRALEPGRYLEVCYEDLVSDPPAAVARLCEFLDEDLHPAMLQHTRLAREKIGSGGHVEVCQPITTSSVGRWKDEMSAFDRKLAGRLVGPTLEKFGYPPGPRRPMTPVEEIRFFTLAAKFELTDTFRSALYAVGMLTLNRGQRR